MKITFTPLLSLTSTKAVRFWFYTKSQQWGKTHKSIFLCVGFTQERFSNFNNNRFFKQIIPRKTLSVRKSFTGNINLGQTVIKFG